jgi:hypothetical protein
LAYEADWEVTMCGVRPPRFFKEFPVTILLWVLGIYSALMTLACIALYRDYNNECNNSWIWEAKTDAANKVIRALIWKHVQLVWELGQELNMDKVWADYKEHLRSKEGK